MAEITKSNLTASATRKHDGWRAVIEFPNGGRQVLVTRYGTMNEAVGIASKAILARVRHPKAAVRDPLPYECQDLSVGYGFEN